MSRPYSTAIYCFYISHPYFSGKISKSKKLVKDYLVFTFFQFNEFLEFEYQKMRRVLVCFIDLSCKIVEKRWYEEGSNGLPIYHIHPQIWVQALRSFLGLVVFERWIFNDEWQSRRNFWVRETPTILADKIQCVTPTSSLILLNVNRVNAPRPNK